MYLVFELLPTVFNERAARGKKFGKIRQDKTKFQM